MRRLISHALLRRSPRRLDRNNPPEVHHTTLSPVEEDHVELRSPVANLFGSSDSTVVDGAPEEGTTVAAAASEATIVDVATSPLPATPPKATVAEISSPPQATKHDAPMGSPEVRTMPNFQVLESQFDAGYDTDGEALAPAEEEEPEFEPEVVFNPLEEGNLTDVPTEPQFIDIAPAAIAKMTVPQLKEELSIRGVQFASNLKKPDLLVRLQVALDNGVKVSVFGGMANSKKKSKGKQSATDMSGFAPGSHWVPLNPNPAAVPEPSNTIANARAPTVPIDEAATIPIKYNFDECFDRPLFQGRQYVPRYDEDGNKETAALEARDVVIRKKLVPRRDFQIRHKLSRHSDPVEFMDAFLPWSSNTYGDKHLSLSKLTTFTNLKAQLANAGSAGEVYPDFQAFSVKEVRQYLGLSIWQGLNPSPQIEMKLKSAFEDPLQGSSYLQQHIGRNGVRKYKEFRAFFSCQDPRAIPPPKEGQSTLQGIPYHQMD
jgi:HeH/LEM domain